MDQCEVPGIKCTQTQIANPINILCTRLYTIQLIIHGTNAWNESQWEHRRMCFEIEKLFYGIRQSSKVGLIFSK